MICTFLREGLGRSSVGHNGSRSDEPPSLDAELLKLAGDLRKKSDRSTWSSLVLTNFEQSIYRAFLMMRKLLESNPEHVLPCLLCPASRTRKTDIFSSTDHGQDNDVVVFARGLLSLRALWRVVTSANRQGANRLVIRCSRCDQRHDRSDPADADQRLPKTTAAGTGRL